MRRRARGSVGFRGDFFRNSRVQVCVPQVLIKYPAKSWEDLVAVHEKWVLDYNFQKHLAHEKREDGRHSPAEVLGWVTGKQFEPDYMYRAFSAICETRTLTRAGYARFRDFLLYGERGLAGKKALINIFQDTLAVNLGIKWTKI